MISTFWVCVQFSGSAEKQIACVPGLAQATARTMELAFDAVVRKLGNRVLCIDSHAFKLLLRK